MFSQDVEQFRGLRDRDLITFSGGVSLSGTAYQPFGMESRRDPFSYTLSANINFRILDLIDVPFSMFMMSQNRTFATPSYNITGLSPRYRWITVHGGWRSMQFSPYSFAGINFLGGGVELQPETFPVRGKMFFGRLHNFVPHSDTITRYMQEPAFARFGGAASIEIGTRRNNAELIFFRAADVENEQLMNDSVSVRPQENMVIELRTRQVLLNQQLTFTFAYAFSAYTLDTRAPLQVYDHHTYADNFGFLFRPRESSFFSSVFDGSLDYSHSRFNVGVSYRRIDPNYQSMGALFMTNDVEETQVNLSTSFLDSRINLSASGGLQRNNLDNNSENDERRLISNINVAYTITERLMISANYANFNTSVSPSQMILFDSIRFVQVTANIGAVISYTLQVGDLSHSFNLAASRQGMNTINTEFTGLESVNNVVQAWSLNYQTLIPSLAMTVSAGISYNLQDMPEGRINALIPMISVGRPFFDRALRTTLSWTESISQNLDGSSGIVSVFRLNASGRFFGNHNISLNTSLMYRRVNNSEGRTRSGEWTATLTYSYTF